MPPLARLLTRHGARPDDEGGLGPARSIDLVKAMGPSGVSRRARRSDRLCEEIDGRAKAFLERPIEGDWPSVWIDATYLKVRRVGRIVSVAVIIAVGVNSDGRREVLGMEIGTSEAEPTWTEILRKLTRRGLRGVKFGRSDAREGNRGRPAQQGAVRDSCTRSNPIERLNGEVKRRTDVVVIFPTDEPLSVSSARSCSNRMTNGRFSARQIHRAPERRSSHQPASRGGDLKSKTRSRQTATTASTESHLPLRLATMLLKVATS